MKDIFYTIHTKPDIADNKICYVKWNQNYHHK